MKGIIEQEIEKCANKFGEYPTTVEVTEREYQILNKEVKKEYRDVGRPIEKDITEFRGCNLRINKKITKFRVIR